MLVEPFYLHHQVLGQVQVPELLQELVLEVELEL
jgi:hypothetical protein